ncbi:protein of unknown function [Paenibacillus alvei]|uniref:Uncharacterized protein n=1 Tax=Paenibacillus alvei TaxID=44250 RepID=A0A383R554_PAEAL|nr:protein of unknown function [Paenibacillus alvei]
MANLARSILMVKMMKDKPKKNIAYYSNP